MGSKKHVVTDPSKITFLFNFPKKHLFSIILAILINISQNRLENSASTHLENIIAFFFPCFFKVKFKKTKNYENI
jgi:hypothetical protein